MNLPVRQGYVLATDSGRAEVEFENGAMAFLNANTVLEFYDLSLQDGARITRLILRQGTASFYVNPSGEDYFSVTGGDFTVQANGKGSFRLNNFDDGSNVQMLSGRSIVLQKKEEIHLAKGQSLTAKVGGSPAEVGTIAASDEFDHWVSSRIDTVSAANRASLQYSSVPAYAPGFASLYTYGSWFTCGSYGYAWQPFGVGLGWSPFNSGQWFWDNGFGWTFVSSQPWGWAPYHYGGWLFDASCGGWFYSPPVYFNYGPYGYGYGGYGGHPRRPPHPIVHPPAPLYHASTAVFVRQNGKLGIVPMNPLDKAGKTPLNLEHGVYSLEPGRTLSRPILSAMGSGKWDTVKSPSRNTFKTSLVPSTPPERRLTSIVEGTRGTHSVLMGHNSAVVFDPVEHRYVSGTAAALAARDRRTPPGETMHPGEVNGTHLPPDARTSWARTNGERGFPGGGSSRTSSAPPRAMTPPPAPRSSFGGGSFGRSGGGSFSGGGGGGYSRGSSAPAVSAPHVSAPSGGGGGGRPH